MIFGTVDWIGPHEQADIFVGYFCKSAHNILMAIPGDVFQDIELLSIDSINIGYYPYECVNATWAY